MSREKQLHAVEDTVRFVKTLILAQKGNINYKLIQLANEGVDEVVDFLLTATPAQISELGHWCKIKEAEINPSYTKPKDGDDDNHIEKVEQRKKKERLQAVEKFVRFVKTLIPARAENNKGNINYKLIQLANEGVDEVVDFLLTATPAQISELGTGARLKKQK